MSKKKDKEEDTKQEEVKKEEDLEESTKTTKNKEESKKNKSSKTTPKKTEVKKEVSKKKKDENQSNSQLRTLIELVNESKIHRKEMLIILNNTDYLKKFYEEEDMMNKGLYVKPTISEIEFKKIIGE